jgi:cell pole-organizing protein PopZ
MSSAIPKIQEPSMEEILASIRRIIADDQDGARAAKAVPPSAPPPAAEDDVLDLAEVEPLAQQAPSKLELGEQDVSFREDNQIDFDTIPLEDKGVVEPLPPPPPSRPAQSPRTQSLLSASTDSSVSQAFGLLSSAVLTDHPRTLEDLVQEMLRPMLKAWLDDQLPTLVERLVKAEIERLARGSR